LEESPQLNAWTIFRFYSPLAISWVFMGMDGPVCESVINRMRHPEINAAAWPILMAIAIWVESPVIDLLSTSTTLARTRQRYETISRFVWYLLLWVTVAHAVVVLTPLYGFVAGTLLGVKPAVAAAARAGLTILVPWSALIGWRRYLQGILIRHGQTRSIGLGTTARVTAMTVTAISLFLTTSLPSTVIAATALLAGVGVECGLIHYVSREVIAKYLSRNEDTGEPPLTTRQLAAFHFPLTATTMVNLMVVPLVSAGLARTEHPVLALAGFGVAGAILFLHRALTFCIPEVVITLYKGEDTVAILRRFSLGVGMFSSSLILILSLSGCDRLLFAWLIQAKPQIADVAHQCYLYAAAVPLVDSAQAYVRGLLTAHHLTVSRLVAVVAAILVLVGVLTLGVSLRWSGPALAACAVSSALLAELAVLSFAWARAKTVTPALAAQ
jgi:hypothetical protein